MSATVVDGNFAAPNTDNNGVPDIDTEVRAAHTDGGQWCVHLMGAGILVRNSAGNGAQATFDQRGDVAALLRFGWYR